MTALPSLGAFWWSLLNYPSIYILLSALKWLIVHYIIITIFLWWFYSLTRSLTQLPTYAVVIYSKEVNRYLHGYT